MGKQIKRRSVTEVAKILKDYRSSNQTIEEYCQHHDLNSGAFNWWLMRDRKISTRNQKPQSPFLQLNQVSTMSQSQDVSIDVEYQCGTRVRVNCSCQLSHIFQFISSLGG